jgi:glycerophosphoryl diester phosphodiesterase
LVVAHRGASAEAPENTLAAYRAALARGAPAAECDVRLSADGVVVVIHDPTLDRTTDGTGPVAARTFAELRALDAGGWKSPLFAGERIPDLAEVLDVVHPRMTLFIDLKDGHDLEERIARVVGARAGVVAIAFDPERLVRIGRLLPQVPTMLLVRRAPDDAPESLAAVATAAHAALLGVERSGVDRRLVEVARAAGLGVFAWTVNDPREGRQLAALGVDGIITDRPDEIAAALGSQRR